jgi:hypothetical protein
MNNVKRTVQGKVGNKQQHTKAYSYIEKIMKKLEKVWSQRVNNIQALQTSQPDPKDFWAWKQNGM